MRGEVGSCPRACYTVAELMELLGVGRPTVYALLRQGKIPSIRSGKKFVVPRAAFHRVMENAGLLVEVRSAVALDRTA